MSARKTFRIAGFSLIEVLVSVAVMSFGLLSLAALQGNLFKSGAESRAQSIALALASEKIEYFDGYRDRSEFQGFTDGTDAAVTVDGIAFTRSWTIQRYAYPQPTATTPSPSFALLASDTGETPAGYVSNNEFKRVQVKVGWTDATGASREVALESALAALSPQDTAKVAKVSSTGGPRGPKIIITNPASEEGVIPIAVGDGSDTAATNPKPEVAGSSNSQRVIETRFDVLTYAALTDTTALAQSRVETVVAGCTCSTGGANTSAHGKRPTYWNGLRYVVPEDATYTVPAGVASGVENQSAQCTVCCRDHHDPANVEGARFDPRRTTHTHELYDASTGTLADIGSDGKYTEACRLIRVDGVFRVAADMYDDYLNLLETDNDPTTSTSDYVPTATATSSYQKFVLDYLNKRFVGGTQSNYNTVMDPAGTDVATLIGDDDLDNGNDINEPHTPLTIDRADNGSSTLKWLHARGLYVDYLEDEAIQAINDAKENCKGAGTTPTATELRTCVLKVLPFTTINLTELADWSTQDTTQIVASNNDFRTTLTSDVPVRGKVVPGTKPTHSKTTDALATMRLSNSGLAVLKGAIDTEDSATWSDSQAFLPDAKWDCTTTDCTGVNNGGTFTISLSGYAFPNFYPTFLISPGATCNPATTGSTRPNPFTCTSQKTGSAQSITIGNYNYQFNGSENADVSCTDASGGNAKTKKLKYTSKTCRNYDVTGVSLTHANVTTPVSDTLNVTGEGTTRETTQVDVSLVEAGDGIGISFGTPVDTVQTPVCTYSGNGTNANDFTVIVPDCPTE